VRISQLVTDAENAGHLPVLACAPQIRPALRRLVAASYRTLPVLSYHELSGANLVCTVGVVSAEPGLVTT
jgi:flagellar biosynthesis protein FlhA